MPPPPPLRLAYVGLSATSSRDTQKRRFRPDPFLPGDRATRAFVLSGGRLWASPQAPPGVAGRDAEHRVLNGLACHLRTLRPHALVTWPEDGLDALGFAAVRWALLQPPRARMKGGGAVWSDFLGPLPCALPTSRPTPVAQGVAAQRHLAPCRGLATLRLPAFIRKVYPQLPGFSPADLLAEPKLVRDRSSLLARVAQRPTGAAWPEEDVLELAHRLVEDNRLLPQLMELASITDLGFAPVTDRGQQVRVRNYFMRELSHQGLYINPDALELPPVTVARSRADSSYPDPPWVPNGPRGQGPGAAAAGPAAGGGERCETTKKFSGAFVFPPEPGWYTRPGEEVYVLDWASLYPSIIRAFQLCYMRVVFDRGLLDDPEVRVEYVPLGPGTCVPLVTHYRGRPVRTFLPQVTALVCESRSQTKRLMKRTDDPRELEVLNARQLAEKVMANSIYGFTGAATSGMGCLVLAGSVTALGVYCNKTLHATAMAEPYLARTVYGDTDSIMVQFPEQTRGLGLVERRALGRGLAAQLADRVSAMFERPMEVEFEAMYAGMNIGTKKKVYSALMYGPDGAFVKLTLKGFSGLKRDRCPWVHRLLRAMAEEMFRPLREDALGEESGPAAQGRILGVLRSGLAELRAACAVLLDRRAGVPRRTAALSGFEVTSSVAAEYKVDSALGAHLTRCVEDETGSAPVPGTRVAFVVAAHPHSGLKVNERATTVSRMASDPGRGLDTDWYLSTQLLKSLEQHFMHLPPAFLESLRSTISKEAHALRHLQSGQRSAAVLLGRKRPRPEGRG